MQRKHWLVVVALLVLGTFGCRELNREPYCNAHPDDPDCGPKPEMCGETMCALPTPVCEPTTTTCVQCVDDRHCLNEHCNAQHTCVECVTDDNCDSNLCLADNRCAAPEDVVYVGGDNATMNATCSLDSPCQNLTQGINALGARKYIKVTGLIVVEPKEVTLTDKNVTILGKSGAKISRTGDGEVLIIKGMMTPEVTLVDLEIVGNAGASGKDCVEIADKAIVTMVRVDVHGHGQAGVSLAGTAKLVMTESQVHDNLMEGVVVAGGTAEIRRSWLYSNKGNGGVYTTSGTTTTIESSVITANVGMFGASIAGNYTIKNNIISANGNPTVTASGVVLNSASGVFEFNTVADNATTNTDQGIGCSVAGVMVSNNILTGNTVTGCIVTYSLTDSFLPDIPGLGNMKGDPMFVKVTEPLQPTFYRIMAGSKARDIADPAATLDVDIDGEPRNDARKDVGADEFKMMN